METLKIVLRSLSESTVTLELTRMSVDDRPSYTVRHLPDGMKGDARMSEGTSSLQKSMSSAVSFSLFP